MKRIMAAFLALWVTNAQAFTMFSWNIHRGVGIDGKLDLVRTAAIIREQKADVVVLQEVDQGTTRSGKRLLAKELADLLGMRMFFGKAIDFQGGEYGQAILLAHPLRDARVVKLSSTGEARIAVLAEVLINEQWVTVGGVHLDAASAQRRAEEGKVLRAALAENQGKIYLAGDWNEGPCEAVGRMWAKAGWLYQKKFGEPFSFPQEKPEIEIDFFWTRGVSQAIDCRVVDVKGASDHRGVVARWH
jgi:endonuclease/exonuclease/phosphatase family metal-dependent hydrolase